MTLKDANEMVTAIHRHHKRVQGHRFSIGATLGGRPVGAIIVGRPVARKSDQVFTAEVTRLVTDGTPNACSFLYSAAARAAKAIGFRRIQTFILDTEPGTSLIAAGWVDEGVTSPGTGWLSRDGRTQDNPVAKRRYAKDLR